MLQPKHWTTLTACASLCLGLSASASALTIVDDGNKVDYDPFHLHEGENFGAVGAIQTGDGRLGSGNAIRGNWMLTAAHVVVGTEGLSVETGGQLGSAQNQFFIPDQWYVPDTYDGNVISQSDIALVHVNPFGGSPAFDDTVQINRNRNAPIIHEQYTMVGYGTTGTGSSGNVGFDGNKRAGHNVYDDRAGLGGGILLSDFDVDPASRDFYGGVRDSIYTGDIESPDDFRIGLESSSAEGDSGGGQFRRDGNDVERLVTITSFGSPSSQFGGVSGDLDVSHWQDWIDDVIENGAAAGANGVGVQVGSPGTAIDVAMDEGDGEGGNSSQALSNLRSNQRYYSGLLQDYFEDGAKPLNINKSLHLLGLTKRGERLTAGELADLLDLDPDASAQQIAGEADDVLQQALAEAFDHEQVESLVAQGTGESQSYTRSLANLSALIDGQAGLNSEPDIDDLSILVDNLDQNLTDPNWSDGDLNHDGVVDEADLAIIEDHWSPAITGQTFDEAVASVPEPSTLLVLSLGTLALIPRRRGSRA